eukprot:SAG11_NODE_34994_length_269_cov_0.547059_1_plen_33_part_10
MWTDAGKSCCASCKLAGAQTVAHMVLAQHMGVA